MQVDSNELIGGSAADACDLHVFAKSMHVGLDRITSWGCIVISGSSRKYSERTTVNEARRFGFATRPSELWQLSTVPTYLITILFASYGLCLQTSVTSFEGQIIIARNSYSFSFSNWIDNIHHLSRSADSQRSGSGAQWLKTQVRACLPLRFAIIEEEGRLGCFYNSSADLLGAGADEESRIAWGMKADHFQPLRARQIRKALVL
jgi:hypothetical protein